MDIRIPRLGEGAESGSIVNILVKEGDRVQKDQTILELENEKAVAPIPSTHAGVVTKIYVKPGDKVSVGHAVIAISEEGGAASSAPAPAAPAPTVAAQPVYTPPAAPVTPASAPASNQDYTYVSKSGLPPAASPTLRRIAQDLGIDLNHVRGTEAGGRIGMADLKNYIQSLQSRAVSGGGQSAGSVSSSAPKAVSSEKIDFSKWGSITRKPSSSLRQKIGQKMTESWTTIPHVTQFEDADITALMELRKKFVAAYEKKGVKLTVTHFVMKAVVAALKKYPIVNSSLEEDTQDIIFKNYIHLGVAVDTEQGLIVPVVRDADKKSMLEIAKDLETLAEKTRARKIAIDDLKGGSFTISNLGSLGVPHFTPIVNKPEVAILGVGRGAWKPVVIKSKTKTGKDKIEPRLLMPLALSYDHRVIDGADGARFIREIVQNLENFKLEDVKLS